MLKPVDMPMHIFGMIEAQLFSHLERIQFGGNNFGEPLMARNWDEIFSRITKTSSKISLVTNAKLLSSYRIKKMVESEVEFNFSLESVSPKSFEKRRGFSFHEFTRIIKETCEEKNKTSGSSAKVNLGFTASFDNIHELEKLVYFAVEYGVDRVTITHFVPWEEKQRYNCLVYHPELCNSIFAEIQRIGEKYELLIDIPEPFKEIYHDKPCEDESTHCIGNNKKCFLPWNSISINESGDVTPCCATSVVMGNITKSAFSEIWNGSRYLKLRNTVNTDNPLTFCRNCALRGVEIGTEKSLSFGSNKKTLLRGIGLQKNELSTNFDIKFIKNTLSNNIIGRRVLPLLHNYYRKHGAFYFHR